MSECISRVSEAVDRIAPVTAIVAIHCMDVSFRTSFTDPDVFLRPSLRCRGVNHTSAAYVILGIATAQYRGLIYVMWTPVEGLVSLQHRRVHLVAFAIVLSACMS